MSQVIIQFQNRDEVVEFTNTVERFPYNMDILRGSNSVADAKSLLGIIALGLGNRLKLRIYSEDCDEMLKEISKYIVAA